MSYPYDWHVPFRPLRDKYALFSCFIIYLSPVNGFIIFFILYLHTRPPLCCLRCYFPHMAPALRTHIYYGNTLLHAGPAIWWPWISMAATRSYCHLLAFLSLSCFPPSGGSFGFRLSCLVLSRSALELSIS